MILSVIASCDQNNLIGYNGAIPWKCPEDMTFFKWKTIRHPVIMGRKTFESLGCKPLNERINIIVSSHADEMRKTFPLSECWFVSHPSFAVPAPLSVSEMLDVRFNEIFIIGGEKIYQYFLSPNEHQANKIYVNKLKISIDAGQESQKSYFPPIPDGFFKHKEIDNDKFTSFTYLRYGRVV